MGIINRDRFVELANTKRFRDQLQYLHAARPLFGTARVNRESALLAYEQIKVQLLRDGQLMEKGFRPWNLDPEVYRSLDRTQPWLGWEFEVGMRSDAARREVIEMVWDTFDNTCFDGEGDGQYRSEITFSPQELSRYKDGTADAQGFVSMIEGVPDLMYMDATNMYAGTHVNISTPEINSYERANMFAQVLNRAIAVLPIYYKGMNTRDKMFGRSQLYGGTFSRGGDNGYYMEGKYFRTTYSSERFKDYTRTAELLVSLTESDPRSTAVNLAQMFFEDEAPKFAVREDLNAHTRLDGMRGGGSINGHYALPNVN